MLQTIRQNVGVMLTQIDKAASLGEWKDPDPRINTLREKLRRLMNNDPAPLNEIRIKHVAQELANISAEAVKDQKWRPSADNYPDGVIQMAREYKERRYIDVQIPKADALDILAVIEKRGDINAPIMRWILSNLKDWDQDMLRRLRKVIALNDDRNVTESVLSNALLMASVALSMNDAPSDPIKEEAI